MHDSKLAMNYGDRETDGSLVMDSAMKRLLFFAVFVVFGCSTPPSNNDNNQNNSDVDMGLNNSNNTSNNVNNVNNVDDCDALGEVFKEAVRAMGRDCISDAECVLANRAGPCDCDIAVNAGSDLASFGDARSLLDDQMCRNPFVCIGNRCDTHVVLTDSGELIPRCVGNECAVYQVMSCTDFEQNKNGGIINDSSCVVDADCRIRTDLNPCNCPEAVNNSFPALAGPVIREMMDINRARCGTTCEQNCAPANGVACVDEGDVKRCRLTN